MFNSIEEIRAKNAAAGFFFFSPATKKFFKSRIESSVIGGRYFVTSEDNYNRTRRLFTVRRAYANGDITTVGEFGAYTSRKDAILAARCEALKVCED